MNFCAAQLSVKNMISVRTFARYLFMPAPTRVLSSTVLPARMIAARPKYCSAVFASFSSVLKTYFRLMEKFTHALTIRARTFASGMATAPSPPMTAVSRV